MSQEEKSTLRLYCTAIDCPVWEAIQKAENVKDHAESRCRLRTYCADNCLAYGYNRWIGLANKRILDNEGKDKYI